MTKFRTRIFIQFLIPILAIYALALGGAIRYLGDSYRDDALNRKNAAMENLTRGLDDWLLSRVSEVLQLSRIPLFRSGNEEETIDYLTSWQDRLSFIYDELYLIDARGQWSSSSGTHGTIEDVDYLKLFFEDRHLFTYAGPHEYYGDIFADKFVIGAPIYDDDDNLDMVLTATIPLSTLDRIFGFYSFEDFNSWMVVNPDTTIIIHENPKYSGLSEKGAYGRVFLDNGTWGEQEVFVRIMRNGWKMIAFVPTDELMEPFRNAYALVIGLGITLVSLVIIIIMIISTSVSRPVNELTEGVHRIMKGDYTSKIRSRTKDEISDLAESFNRLTSRMTTLRTDDRFSFLGHVSARMAHELRKPLHIIQLAARALEKKDADRSRLIGIIDEEIANADRFVEEILSFSHDERLDKQLYSPEKLMSRVVDKFRLLGEEVNIQFILETRNRIPEIYMDVMQMEEVFGNIIQNGMDAILDMDENTQGSIRTNLEVNEEREIQIRISDTGNGFDKELIDRLFDPYFTTREKGTGLGLSVSYRILMAHGARITLGNHDGHGVVTITFPI